MRRQFKLTDINEYGVIFSVTPFISLKMSAEMIKLELQRANEKLDETMKQWKEDIKKAIEDDDK